MLHVHIKVIQTTDKYSSSQAIIQKIKWIAILFYIYWNILQSFLSALGGIVPVYVKPILSN